MGERRLELEEEPVDIESIMEVSRVQKRGGGAMSADRLAATIRGGIAKRKRLLQGDVVLSDDIENTDH
jgi:hypothetical protein